MAKLSLLIKISLVSHQWLLITKRKQHDVPIFLSSVDVPLESKHWWDFTIAMTSFCPLPWCYLSIHFQFQLYRNELSLFLSACTDWVNPSCQMRFLKNLQHKIQQVSLYIFPQLMQTVSKDAKLCLQHSSPCCTNATKTVNSRNDFSLNHYAYNFICVKAQICSCLFQVL